MLPLLRALRGSVGELIDAMSEIIKVMIPSLGDLAGWAASPGSGFWSAKAVTDPLKEIFGNFGTIVKGLNDLAEADIEAWQSIGAKVPILEDAIREVVAALGRVALVISLQVAFAARALAEACGPVMDIVAGAVDAVLALAEMPDLSQRITSGAQRKAAEQLAIFIGDLVVALGAIGLKIKAELQDAARALAEAAGPVVELVADALEAMGAIGNTILAYVSTATWRGQGLTGPLETLGQFIEDLIVAFGAVAVRLSGDLQEAARALAENAGPVVELVGTALEALNALGQEYLVYTDMATWKNASRSPLETLGQFIEDLTVAFGAVSGRLSGALQKAARALAENAEPVVELVGTALEALNALGQEYLVYTDMATWKNASRSPLETLGQFIEDLTVAFGAVSGRLSGALQTAARDLAENAGPVLELVATALEALTALTTVKMPVVGKNFPLQEAMDELVLFLGYLVIRFGQAATLVGTELQDAARALAENAGPVLGVVQGALDALTTLTTVAMPVVSQEFSPAVGDGRAGGVPARADAALRPGGDAGWDRVAGCGAGVGGECRAGAGGGAGSAGCTDDADHGQDAGGQLEFSPAVGDGRAGGVPARADAALRPGGDAGWDRVAGCGAGVGGECRAGAGGGAGSAGCSDGADHGRDAGGQHQSGPGAGDRRAGGVPALSRDPLRPGGDAGCGRVAGGGAGVRGGGRAGAGGGAGSAGCTDGAERVCELRLCRHRSVRGRHSLCREAGRRGGGGIHDRWPRGGAGIRRSGRRDFRRAERGSAGGGRHRGGRRRGDHAVCRRYATHR